MSREPVKATSSAFRNGIGALATVAAHPLAGIGFDRIQDVFAATFPPAGGQGNAQSTYLQIAAEGGALGDPGAHRRIARVAA